MTFKTTIMWDDYDHNVELTASAIDFDKLFDTFDYVTVTKDQRHSDCYFVNIIIDGDFDPLHSGASFINLWDSCKYIR